jgi:hypothetical protein
MILKNPIETTNLKMDVFMMPDEDTSTASQVPRVYCGTGSVRTYPKKFRGGTIQSSDGHLRQGFAAQKWASFGSDSSFQD